MISDAFILWCSAEASFPKLFYVVKMAGAQWEKFKKGKLQRTFDVNKNISSNQCLWLENATSLYQIFR